MFFKSKRIALRWFTIVLMAIALAVTYPGTSLRANTSSQQQCIQECGDLHSSLLQCYEQAACKRACRQTQCNAIYNSYQCYSPGGAPNIVCIYERDQAYNSCVSSMESAHTAATSFCDRIYWEHCPDPH